MGGVAWLFIWLCSCLVFTRDGCLWHGCLQSFMSGTYITIKQQQQKRIITCWHTLPQFWNQPFLSWFLLGKKVLKSQGLGEGGQKTQTSIITWVSYGDVMCSLVIIVNPTFLNIWKLATSCEELTHWKRLWCWEGLGAGGNGDNRGWDG